MVKVFLSTDFSEDRLKFAAQIGADGVSGAPKPRRSDKGFYTPRTLIATHDLVKSHGLEWAALRMAPWEWTYRWMLGLDGADEQIENYKKTIRSVGEAGIGLLIYNMHALRIYRTSADGPERAGARATRFKMLDVEGSKLMEHPSSGVNTKLIRKNERRPITDQMLWENLRRFLEAVLPVAEESGVRLGLHPDDPPVPEIAGVARIMRSASAFRKFLDLVPSPNSGVVFCQGCFTEMGCDIPAEIMDFGKRKKIFSVDFRNIKGELNDFQETFPNTGNADMTAAMQAYHDAGFDGWMTPDHAIHMDGDTDWGHRYWAYAVGHIHGLDQALRANAK